MKSYITIAFEDEAISSRSRDRTVSIDDPVTIPDVGEHAQNSASGPNEAISGTLLSRTYRYRTNELHVVLLLRHNYAKSP